MYNAQVIANLFAAPSHFAVPSLCCSPKPSYGIVVVAMMLQNHCISILRRQPTHMRCRVHEVIGIYAASAIVTRNDTVDANVIVTRDVNLDIDVVLEKH